MSADSILTVAPVSLPVSSEVDLMSIHKAIGGIRHETVYINNTNIPVTVMLRNGLGFTVETSNVHLRHFIIREIYTIPYRYLNEFTKILGTIDESAFDYGDFGKIKEAFLRHPAPNRYVDVRIVIDATIMQDSLKQAKSIYVANKDLVVSIHSDMNLVEHPFNSRAQLMEHYRHIRDGRSGSAFFIEIIDNDAMIGERYFYLAKKVYKITPKKDPERLDGVYYCVVNTIEDKTEVVQSAHFDFEEAEEQLGLCKTKDEAISAGDIKALRQEEIARLVHEKTVLEATIQTEQMESKRLLEDMKQEMTRLEQAHQLKVMDLEEENARLKMVREESQAKRKDEYDDRKRYRDDFYAGKEHARKETIELLKFIPAALAAGLAIYAIFRNPGKS